MLTIQLVLTAGVILGIASPSTRWILMLDYDTIFGASCFALAMLSMVWLLLERRSSLDEFKYYGSSGTALAAVILAGTWLPAYLPWIWMIPQLSMPLWLLSLVLMGFGVNSVFRQHGNKKRWLVSVGFLSLGINAVAILTFLVMATISAGGV